MITHITNRQRLKLLKMLMELAPTSEAANNILADANEANREGRGDKYVVCALCDGVLYGNWPWVTNQTV